VPQLIIAAVVIVAAIVVGVVLQRRRVADAPAQVSHLLPTQLDRRDFPAADVPWLVVVFSSATCHTCADVVRKAQVLACPDVTVYDAEYGAHTSLHAKYVIDAVPIVVVADGDGVVRAGFVGPVTATDLWAAVAEARQPGSSPEPELGH
jgi:hypothetical protein